jgi:hypothetical protein
MYVCMYVCMYIYIYIYQTVNVLPSKLSHEIQTVHAQACIYVCMNVGICDYVCVVSCLALRLASSICCMYRSRTEQQTRDGVSNIWVIFVYIIYVTFFTHIYRLRNGIIYFTVKNSVGDIWRETNITCRSRAGHYKGGVYGHDVMRCNVTNWSNCAVI